MFSYENDEQYNNKNFRISKNKDFSWPLHMHRNYELIAVTKGKVKIDVFDKSYILTENHTIFIFPNQLHSFSNLESSELILSVFKPELIMEFSKNAEGRVPIDNSMILKDYNWITLYKQLKETDRIEKIKGVLYYYCGMFAESHKFISFNSYLSKKYDLISKSFEYIDKNYMDNCNLKDLAQFLNYDYTYLSKFFLKNVGISFNEYVNRRKIEYACYLLSNSNELITEVSQSCGFDNLRTFNRNFQKFMNISPKQYRINKELITD